MSDWGGGEGGSWGRAYELMEERKRRNLTAQVSVQEVNEIFDAHKRREQQKKQELIDRLTGGTMTEFNRGDKVQLKDTKYAGEVINLGFNALTFRTSGGLTISVSDEAYVEHALDPRIGDIYRDKEGDEWVIFASAYPPSVPSKKNLYARRIDQPSGTPRNTTSFLGTQAELERWAERTAPVLVRRRGE